MSGLEFQPTRNNEQVNPNLDSVSPNQERWMDELQLAFNFLPPPTAKEEFVNPATPPQSDYNIDESKLKPVDKTKPTGLLYHQVKGKVDNVDCEINDFVEKVDGQLIPKVSEVIYSRHKPDNSVEPLKGLKIPFNGARPIVGANTRLVARQPFVVGGEQQGYDCTIQSYPKPAASGSKDYLVQTTKCFVTNAGEIIPSEIDRNKKPDMQGHKGLYHACVWRYAGLTEEEVHKEVLDKATGEMVETVEMVKSGHLIPVGLKSKTFYADYNGGRQKKIMEERYVGQDGKPAADDSKPTRTTVYNPNDQSIVAIVEFENGLKHIRKVPNFEKSGNELKVEYDKTGENWLTSELTDVNGKLVASVERPDGTDKELIVRHFNTIDLSPPGLTIPPGSALVVLKSREIPGKPGEREYYTDQMQIYDSQQNIIEALTLKDGEITFTRGATGEITGVEGGVFFYHGKPIHPLRLEQMLINNRALQKHMRELAGPGK